MGEDIKHLLGVGGFITAMMAKNSLQNLLSDFNKDNIGKFLTIYLSGFLGIISATLAYTLLESNGIGGIAGWILAVLTSVIAISIIYFLITFLFKSFSKNVESNDDYIKGKHDESRVLLDSHPKPSTTNMSEVTNENSNIIQQKNDALLDNPSLSSLENEERCYHKEEKKDESENDQAAPIVEKNGNNLLSENEETKHHNKKAFIGSRFFKYACICIAILLIAVGLFYAVPHYQYYKYEKALSLIEKGDLVKGGDKLKSIVGSSFTDSGTHTLALMGLVDLYHQRNNMDSAVFYARLIPDDIDKKELYMGYAYCSGISPNYTMAYYWWKKGANKGDAKCWDNMGLLYHEGWGTKADIRKALKYFKKALDVNPEDPFALRHIGEIYLEYMNVEKAQKYYQMAADLGDEEAQEALSRIELEGANYE